MLNAAPTYEYRRFSRVPVVATVTFGACEGMANEGETRNISANGILIACEQTLPLQSPCTVRFRLGAEEIETRGTVVRVERDAIAMEITAIKEKTVPYLRELILSHAEHPEQLDTEMIARADLLPASY